MIYKVTVTMYIYMIIVATLQIYTSLTLAYVGNFGT